MKKLLSILFILLTLNASAQTNLARDIPRSGEHWGFSRTNLNWMFQYLFSHISNSIDSWVQVPTNINFTLIDSTNSHQIDYYYSPTNGGSSGGSTPQGPWTNDVNLAGFAALTGNYIQVTNQVFFRVGTNILAAQGWPNATNVSWNGQSLINAASSGGGSTEYTNYFYVIRGTGTWSCGNNGTVSNSYATITTNVGGMFDATDMVSMRFHQGFHYGQGSVAFSNINNTAGGKVEVYLELNNGNGDQYYTNLYYVAFVGKIAANGGTDDGVPFGWSNIYNSSPTNIWRVKIHQNSGGTISVDPTYTFINYFFGGMQ